MKGLISFLIRYIPRRYLQLFSHWGLRVVSIFYRGKGVKCPVCENEFKKFLPYGRKARENALCPSCLSLERHRLMWLFLADRTDFFSPKYSILHIAPELCFIDRFKALYKEKYVTADLESPLADVKMDVMKMPFEDASFHTVFCNHVLEHVADDFQAMREIYRVLDGGGWAILQVPLFYPLKEKTFEDVTIKSAKERERAFGQSDHVRMYGKDYPERLRSVGFEVEEVWLAQELGEDKTRKFALPTDEPIFFCRKPL